MSIQELFPHYISRKEPEEEIRDAIRQVQQDQKSLALLLYGIGGVGKSFLLSHLGTIITVENSCILGPTDVDDLEFWSLTNLQKHLAELIDGEYFIEYKDYISQMPRFERKTVGRETALAYLRKGDDIFARCYKQFVETSNLTPVIILDTVEAIRGADTLKKLVVWIKRLPATLFILAGRPPQEGEVDSVDRELGEAPALPIKKVVLGEFTREESLTYLNQSGVASGLTAEEKDRLVLLSQGHPLWLSLSVYYTGTLGVPEEIQKLNFIAAEQSWPYKNGPLHDSFIRRLVVPYREREFWHEAVLRLGVIRWRLNEEQWRALMDDQELPEEVSNWSNAWQIFLKLPWVRPRANGRYVTLQDAMAEELAKRIIPHQDYDRSWRKGLWQKALEHYSADIAQKVQELEARRARLDEELKKAQPGDRRDDLLGEVLELDNRSMDLFLLQTAHLYYLMLVDYQAGCQQFVVLFDQAAEEHQYRFIELLWSEMQRFLPGEQVSYALDDVIKPEVTNFQEWYRGTIDLQYEINTRVARYQFNTGQAADSENRLDQLWEVCRGNLVWEYEIVNLRANARIRIPGRAREAEADFTRALDWTRLVDAPPELKNREGEALKELGYYYRNAGNWKEASAQYLHALRITPYTDHKERANIQAQYAYVLALRGLYQDARDLVESALKVRRSLNLPRYIGMTLSIKGEVYRYARDFETAWEAYQEAEDIFESLDDWSWLGLVQQEMAICLYQAYRLKKPLPGFNSAEEMLERARVSILMALDYCREFSRRAYPSALNRAGRILAGGFGQYDQGLAYLYEGITEAEAVVDGWFWFANLIEYVELSYHVSRIRRDRAYLANIESKAQAIEVVKSQYEFSDLKGRWELLQGELRVDEAETTEVLAERESLLDRALEHFKQGYPLIGYGYVGSHGAVALAEEFHRLERVMRKLPAATLDRWFSTLNTAWSNPDPDQRIVEKERQEGSLIAFLTELDLDLHPIQAEGQE